MRIRFSLRIAPAILALTALYPAALTHAQMGGPSASHAIVTKEAAYVLLPPELISAPTVRNMQPSPNERLLLIERENFKLTPAMLRAAVADRKPPIGERSLVLWDSTTRSSRDVWKDSTGTVNIQQMAWLPQTETAIIVLNQYLPPDPKKPASAPQMRQGLLRLTSSMEKAQVLGLTELTDYSSVQLFASPNQPFAIVQETLYKTVEVPQPDGTKTTKAENRQNLYVLNEAGRLGARITVPEGVAFLQVQWAADGSPIVQAFMSNPTSGKLQPKWYAMNTKTAELRLLEKQPAPGKEPELMLKTATRIPAVVNGPLRVRMTKQAVKEGETTQSVGLLWLESTEPPDAAEKPAAGAAGKPIGAGKQRTLVSSDSAGGQLAARGEVVLYNSHGAMWAAPLLKLTLAEYETAVVAAQRTVILSNGKQIGLAAMMYAQDYDETLPDGNGINSKLEPYLKNSSVFEGFTYTFGGGKLKDIESPAETELGFVEGPGGRAVIYIDGHVKWRPNM